MFYEQLNHFIDLIEQNLDDINCSELSNGAGLNLATIQKVFPLITGVTLADYVRKRRLTLAVKDLVQSDLRILDIALKYGYTSTATFSRAFYRYHGIKPSEVKQSAQHLKYYPKLSLAKPAEIEDLNYEVIKMGALDLCGLEIISDYHHIHHDAPALFELVAKEYATLPHPDYGVLHYDYGRDDLDKYHYYVLWLPEHLPHALDFVQYHIPPLRWLKFSINSQNATDIQNISELFYQKFLPTCPYQLRPEADLEYYHDDKTDFLIPIY